MLFYKNKTLHLQHRNSTIVTDMENRNKKKRPIALLSVLAGIAYLYLISIDFINHWDSFANSFMEGYNASSEGRVGQLNSQSFSLLLNAEDIQHYYADSLMNLKNDRYMPAKMQIVDVKYDFTDFKELRKVLTYRVIIFTIVFMLLLLYIAVPLYFYKILGAFYRNHIFSYRNVKRIKIVGSLLLIIYGLQFIFDITLYCYKNKLIEIPHYNISIHLSGAEWLFLGLITLLIGNILKRSVELKEESELTI